MQREAAIARALGIVAVGGGTAAGARRAAERAVARGATALISFGIAGGLDPALLPGALVIPARIVAGDATWPTDAALTAALGGPTAAALAGAEAAVATPAAKAALASATGGAAVDMESAAVAEVAAARGVRFAALRAVADPAARRLPAVALHALTEDGRPALGRVLAGVLRAPWVVPSLLQLARDARAAERALGRAVGGLPNLAADPRF